MIRREHLEQIMREAILEGAHEGVTFDRVTREHGFDPHELGTWLALGVREVLPKLGLTDPGSNEYQDAGALLTSSYMNVIEIVLRAKARHT